MAHERDDVAWHGSLDQKLQGLHLARSVLEVSRPHRAGALVEQRLDLLDGASPEVTLGLDGHDGVSPLGAQRT